MSQAPEDKPLLASTWAELRRRKVVRAAIAYAAIAWIVLQLGEITFEPLGLPPWALTWTILIVILGFPVVLVLAWMFDGSGAGLARDRTGSALGGPLRLFILALVVLTVGGVAWWLTDVYRADDGVAAMVKESAVPAAAPATPPNSIAVLPFQDMSPDGDQAWFADGIAEELLDRLARIEGLRVAARTSSFALRGSEQDVKAIGRLLDVGTVLEGSVRKADGMIRVTVQLIDTGSGYHLWSEKYDRSDQGIFDLQDEITGEIVEQLRERIPGLGASAPDAAARATTLSADTGDVQAHELYLQGRLHWRQRTPASLARAIELFEQAIGRDPSYARAWSGLADAQLLLADYGSLSSAEAVKLAEPAAVKALELAPGLGEAWATLGLLRMTAGQLDAAEGNFLEAIRLDPNYEMASMWLGGLYGRQGRFKARLEVLTRALALSPLDPAININVASTRLATGDSQGARQLLRELLEATPESTVVRRSLADFERLSGNLAEALRQADIVWRQEPDNPNAISMLGLVLAGLGRFDEAEKVAATTPASVSIRPLLLHFVAVQRDPRARIAPELDASASRLIDSKEPLVEELKPVAQMAALSAYWHGDRARALRLSERLVADRGPTSALLQDETDFAAQLAFALREAGRETEAQAWHARARTRYAQLLEQGMAGPYVDYSQAGMALFEGREDQALERLATAVRTGFSEIWLLDADPRWQTLRERPAFERIRTELKQRIERERQASLKIATY
jgi:TolB-like protein/Flp pilus assembly protein TadD